MAFDWFKKFPLKYRLATAPLSMIQRGAYSDLIDYYFINGPFRPEKRYEAGIARTSAEKKAVDDILKAFFILEQDGFYHQDTADAIKAEQVEISEKRSFSGKKGGEAKQANAKQMLSKCLANPSKVVADLDLDLDKEKDKNKEAATFRLPEWVPTKEWNGFVEMRKKLKKPLGDHAKELLIKKLARFKEQGCDPSAVLDQSTVNSWQGLFELKNPPITQAQPELTEAQKIDLEENKRISRLVHEKTLKLRGLL